MVDAASEKKKNRRRKRKSKEEDVIETEKPEMTVDREDASVNIEDEPPKKRSKKKKKVQDETSDVPESKMSKRQLKREKHAQRVAEAEAAAHKAVQMQALSYLSLWKYNRAEWKFNKVKQIWLHKHKFDPEKLPEEVWPAFIEYFASASGGIKKVIIEDSDKIIENMEKWSENKEDKETKEKKPSDIAYQRARDLLQNIQV